jgi:hypothetical protein
MKVKNDELINSNLDYLIENSVMQRIESAAKHWCPKAEELKTNLFVRTFFAHLFSGLGDPHLIAEKADVYRKLPKSLALQFSRQRTDLSDQLAGEVGEGQIKKGDIGLLIELINASSLQIHLQVASKYLYLLATSVYESLLPDLKQSIQQFLNQIRIVYKELKLEGREYPFKLTTDMNIKVVTSNQELSEQFLESCFEINKFLICQLNEGKISQDELDCLINFMQLKKPSLTDFALRYISLFSHPHYAHCREALKRDLIRGLRKYQESPTVKE